MYVLGIDPGYDRLGYGILHIHYNKSLQRLDELDVVDYGLITSDRMDNFPARLEQIARGVEDILLRYSIDVACVERYFITSRRKHATEVAEARGVILYVLSQNDIEIVEYTPNHVKMIVADCGKARKKDVEQKVMMYLALDEKPKPDDVSDALALALCYAFELEGKR